MDRRIQILIGFAAVLAIAVIAIVVGRGGSDDNGGGTPTFEKPTVEVPKGDPPKQLETNDIKVGDGTEAKAGDNVTVQYVGVLYDNGQEFDSSYNTGQPFPFTLGQGGVIPGWDQGIPGMKVGGERQLIIPPDLAYGAQGSPPKIPPNATLVFDVQLVSVN
jgi:peptidylprolyl isomerase